MPARNPRIALCERCQRERPYFAKGMCRSCYGWIRRVANKGICPQCGKEQIGVYASGKPCNTCRAVDWNIQNKERHAEHERIRRARDPEAYRQSERKRNVIRRDKRIVYNHKYYQQRAHEMRKYQSDYRKAHPEWVSEVARRRRSRKLGLLTTLTNSQWLAILEQFKHSCAYCGATGVKLVHEHDIPVTRGGGYTAENIVPACQSCNSRKHTMTGDEFRGTL